MNRRSYLRAFGAAAGVGGLGGCLDFTSDSDAGSGRQEGTQSTGTGEPSSDTATTETEAGPTSDLNGCMYQYDAANTGSLPGGDGPKRADWVRWQFEPDEFGAELSSPVADGGSLFVGSGEGTLYAVNAEDGERRWTYDAEGSLTLAPAVVDGTVYVGGDDNALYAVDAETGAEEWTFEARSDMRSPPTVDDGTVYVGSADQHLYALAADTGELEWREHIGTAVQCVSAVADGSVVFQSGLRMYALDASTGEVRWEQYINTRSRGVAIRDGIAYVSTGNGGHEQHVLTFELGSGNERWRAGLDGNGGRGVPATAGDTVYVSDGSGKLYAFETETGREVWTATTGDRTNSSPLVVDGVVYLTTFEGFYGFDADDGSERFATDAVEAFTQTPIVRDGTAYVADNGVVTALEDRSNGGASR